MGNGAPLGLHRPQYCVDMWLQEHKMRENAQKQNVQGIRITGVTGMFSHHLNSFFAETGKIYNKRMLYRSLSNPNYWLRYAKHGKWVVSNTKDMQENSLGAICHCGAFGLMDPSCAKLWHVLGAPNAFGIQKQVVATEVHFASEEEAIKQMTAMHTKNVRKKLRRRRSRFSSSYSKRTTSFYWPYDFKQKYEQNIGKSTSLPQK